MIFPRCVVFISNVLLFSTMYGLMPFSDSRRKQDGMKYRFYNVSSIIFVVFVQTGGEATIALPSTSCSSSDGTKLVSVFSICMSTVTEWLARHTSFRSVVFLPRDELADGAALLHIH